MNRILMDSPLRDLQVAERLKITDKMDQDSKKDYWDDFVSLVCKQICRYGAYAMQEKDVVLPPKYGKVGVYSPLFFTAMYNRPRSNAARLMKLQVMDKVFRARDYDFFLLKRENPLKEFMFSQQERQFFYNYLWKVKEMTPESGKKWNEFQHYMHAVYQNFATSNPNPHPEELHPCVLKDIRKLFSHLVEADPCQLYLRITRLLREYCLVALNYYSRICDHELSITKLFYFYEAMLSAAKSLQRVFQGWETYFSRNYQVRWIDFNTCVFINYFFETEFVQTKIFEFQKMKMGPNDIPGLHSLLADLKCLWIREKMRLINEQGMAPANKAESQKDELMMEAHRKLLNENFWIVRTKNILKQMDMNRFDHHIFKLMSEKWISDENLILNPQGQCLCQECALGALKLFVKNGSMTVLITSYISQTNKVLFCQKCEDFVNIEDYEDHLDAELRKESNPGAKEIASIPETESQADNTKKAKMATEEEIRKMMNTKPTDPPPLKSRLIEKKVRAMIMNDAKKLCHARSCDHQKEVPKCDCAYCEVFGSANQKNNDIREKLRNRLYRRREQEQEPVQQKQGNIKTKLDGRVSLPLPDLEIIKYDDISWLTDFIEGHLDKVALVNKKAAKKARQKMKKEEERLKAEEERKFREEEERRKEEERILAEKLAKELEEKARIKAAKKERKKLKKKANSEKVVEETIPAMVTIKRVVKEEGGEGVAPSVTITLTGSTPDQDKLLYTLVGGEEKPEEKAKKKEPNKKDKKKKNNETKPEYKPTIKFTMTVDPKNSNVHWVPNTFEKKEEAKKEKKSVEEDLNLPMLRLPPGITITKVDGPLANRNFKSNTLQEHTQGSTINVGKSGVIVVDTEKLIQQTGESKGGKKKKKKNKKDQVSQMVTLKNPIFQAMPQKSAPVERPAEAACAPAAIFTSQNGMVTIRSSRLQQSLDAANANGMPMPMPSLLSDLKPVIGPDVPTPLMPTFSVPETSKMSPFNAQEILSGLPGIEITKVEKNAIKPDLDLGKNQAAQVSIIPTQNGTTDKFFFDKDDWTYDSVFTPKDILEDDMDAEERELEAFKRFCQQSVPPKRKEKVAHLNVKDIVLKKKHDAMNCA